MIQVDHHCKVDPELVSDLDKVGLPFESDNNPAAATEAGKKAARNQSGNWDVYIEKPAEINNWGSELTSRPDSTWGVKPESSPVWGNSNCGWGDALVNPSWHVSSNNHYSSNNWNDFNAGSNNRYQDHGGSNNRYQERSNMSGRKRSGGHFQHRNNKQRNETEGYQRSGWQDQRGRNREWRPVHNRDRQNG
ncbi:hypothetical protein QOZ80_5BG0427770 [Eleusine coracana subsp. coracana]|nr:hypothetical protein QOZ80_5BG0427770 [Eleusine coracana subsp. coracana]